MNKTAPLGNRVEVDKSQSEVFKREGLVFEQSEATQGNASKGVISPPQAMKKSTFDQKIEEIMSNTIA